MNLQQVHDLQTTDPDQRVFAGAGVTNKRKKATLLDIKRLDASPARNLLPRARFQRSAVELGMPSWRDGRNEVARARLRKAMPPVFPAVVLIHALARPFVPPLPRLAVESYWRHHPVRADRLARALAARSPEPEGWRWLLASSDDDGRARTFRVPPAPFREARFRAEPGTCCLCGQPVYRFGWHRDLWGDAKTNPRARWHACCVAAWKVWNAPADHAKLLARLQRRRCAVTGLRLLRDREVDHRMPLHRVWRSQRDLPWAALLRFWGFPNLQAINRDAHRMKSAAEASHRAVDRADRAA